MGLLVTKIINKIIMAENYNAFEGLDLSNDEDVRTAVKILDSGSYDKHYTRTDEIQTYLVIVFHKILFYRYCGRHLICASTSCFCASFDS